MRLQTIIIINRAPFNNIQIDFSADNISLLSGINGAGKTTIISYIVDSFFELARKTYKDEFEDKPDKYYRISSNLFSLDGSKPSLVYLRYSYEGKNIDYIDVRGNITNSEYDKIITISDKISFSTIESELNNAKNVKRWTIDNNQEIRNIFSNYLLTYFPSYRYETPYYLTDPYKIKLSFSKDMTFSGSLINPIEVISDLPQIANWIMDVVLDRELYKGSAGNLFVQINNVLNCILESKIGVKTRFGIGMRNYGASRIAIMNKDTDSDRIYPSIFNMSSGELALLCLFIELIKQSDRIGKTAKNVSGIVLIDEIEKHLHIELQKNVLPKLIEMFPNIQFIASSHSPFLGLGLEENKTISYSIFDLDNECLICPPNDNELFREVYNMMIHQNEQFFKDYKQLQQEIYNNSKPIIITEGKSDWKHIKAAMDILNIHDLDFELYEYEDTIGDKKLKQMLEGYSRLKQPRKVIGMFDRDKLNDLELSVLKTDNYKDYGNNVFCFAIPLVNTEEYGEEISIEHYYHRQNLTKLDSYGRRLFLGDEFFKSGNSKDGKYYTRCKGIDEKVNNCGIVDEKVYYLETDTEGNNSIALSKNSFAELILKDRSFTNEFSFTNFYKIFDVIREIINS